MNTVNFRAVPEIELHSPSKKFHSFCRNVSVALGSPRNTGTWGGGHPFDLQIRRVPPGAAICPYHSHLGQWEAFLIRSGTATVRVGTAVSSEKHVVRPGHVFIHPPGEAHQLTNTGDTDLEVFIFADNPPVDGWHYPDSNKWGLRSPNMYFRVTECDYFDGEDPLAPSAPPDRTPPTPVLTVTTPFSARLRHIDDLAWDAWESPKKKFRGTSKELSIALGAKRHSPAGLDNPPFDLELGRIAPGERYVPFHYHTAQWEMFIFLEGTATVRAGEETAVLHAGDVVIHPPFEPHDVTNTGDTDLLYLLVADQPAVDGAHYPDSNKWCLREPRKFFRMQEVDWLDGEE